MCYDIDIDARIVVIRMTTIILTVSIMTIINTIDPVVITVKPAATFLQFYLKNLLHHLSFKCYYS